MSSLGEVGHFHPCQGWKPTYNSQLYNLPLFLVNSPGGQRKGDGCVLQPEPFRELKAVHSLGKTQLPWPVGSNPNSSAGRLSPSRCVLILSLTLFLHRHRPWNASCVPTQGTVRSLTLTSVVSACPQSLSRTNLWSVDSGWQVWGIHKLPGIVWTIVWVCALLRRAGLQRSPSHATLPLDSDAPATLASFS